MSRFAIFTIVRNEPFFLKLWCDYYTHAFAEADMYVLDNGTEDNSVSDAKKMYPKINIVSVPTTWAFDHMWLLNTVHQMQTYLFKDHDCVVFAESDEFLIPGDAYADLSDYCKFFMSTTKTYARAKGYGVVHQIDTEPALDLSVKSQVLKHRNVMFDSPQYDKTLISRMPLRWGRGHHQIYIGDVKKMDKSDVEADLSLLHAQQLDINVYYDRVMDRFARLKIKNAMHGSKDRAAVETFYRTNKIPWDNNTSVCFGEPIVIPQSWKDRLVFKP